MRPNTINFILSVRNFILRTFERSERNNLTKRHCCNDLGSIIERLGIVDFDSGGRIVLKAVYLRAVGILNGESIFVVFNGGDVDTSLYQSANPLHS